MNDTIREGRLHEAIVAMSSLRLIDFPPYWDAPPHLGYGQQSPSMASMFDAILTSKSAPWVKEMYLEKMRYYISKSAVYSRPSFGLDEINESQLDRFAGLLESRPDYGPELAASLRSEITRLVDREPERIESDKFSQWRMSIDRLLQSGSTGRWKRGNTE